MLSNRRSWPGEIWCGSAKSTKPTGGQVSIGCCWFQSCLLHTHTYIYMYSTGVWAEISTVNLHTFNAIAFYCSHSHRPQCRYITGPQDIYIYSEIHALHLLYWLCFFYQNPNAFWGSCDISLPFLAQETPDVVGIDKPGTEKAGKVLLVCSLIFLERPFFQVRTSQG